jgi:branched-chain amino acid transport system ATP-binding protein
MAVILNTKGLRKSFGAVTAAAGISIAVEADSVVGLIGTNGAGKTTFVNMVTGYLKPDAGDIFFKDRDVTELHPRDITRLGICRSFQIPQLYDSLTVFENLVIALGIRDRNVHGSVFSRTFKLVPAANPLVVGAAEKSMQRFGLLEYRDRAARVLPEGVRKLLDIAMALVSEPEVLILDEPTSGVSADEKFPIMDMVMGAARSHGCTVIFVEHDMEIVIRYSQRIVAFYEGRILADGKPADVLSNEQVQTYVIGGLRSLGTGAPGVAHA